MRSKNGRKRSGCFGLGFPFLFCLPWLIWSCFVGGWPAEWTFTFPVAVDVCLLYMLIERCSLPKRAANCEKMRWIESNEMDAAAGF